jgi:competence protein ComEC
MVAALLAFVAGLGLQLQQAVLFGPWVYGGILAVAAVFATFVAIKNRAIQVLTAAQTALLWAALAALGFAWAGTMAAWRAQQALASELEGADLDIQGLIASMPQPTPQGQRFRLHAEQAHLNGQAVKLPARLELSWYHSGLRSHPGEADGGWHLGGGPPPLRAGERWQLRVRLKAVHGNANPHGFDYELWQWEQGVAATGYVRAGALDPAPQRLASTWYHPVEQARQAVRERIVRTVREPRTAGVLAALTLGDQAAIERADWDVFRATGVAHLVSISGLHITLFAWVAVQLIGALWRRSALWGWRLCERMPAPVAAQLGGLILAGAYALFSGFAVPAQRTLWMLAAATALKLLGLRWHWTKTWALVCAVVVAADPWALLSAGFWLSFVAVGVLFASGQRAEQGPSNATNIIANTQANTPVTGQFGSNNGQILVKMLKEQLWLSVALAPLTLLLFGQVSLVGLLANVVAIPWVTLLVTPAALLGVLFTPLWHVAAGLLQAWVAVMQSMAAWPGAVWAVAAPPPLLAAAALAGGALAVLHLPWAVRGAGLLLVVPLLWYAPARPAPGQFELLAADVGQGNAVLLRTHSHSLLYDAGPRFSSESDAGHRTLVPLLRALGERLDLLVLSHRDSDHIGGAQAVLAMQPWARLLASLEGEHPLGNQRRIEPCEAGLRWAWDGVSFEVLHPLPGDTSPKPNTISCVLRVSNGSQTALLLGDIEAAQEAQLVQRLPAQTLRATWLLAPHHGSKTSSSPALVQATQPRFVVVQAGYRNRFFHPVPEVAARWREAGAHLIATPSCGAATWSSSAPEQVQCERQRAPKYWQHRIENAE